jgi:hypothetical protein
VTLAMYRIRCFAALCLSCLLSGLTLAEDSVGKHPRLLLTADGVQHIRSSLGRVPLFDRTVEITKREVDAEMASGIHVPLPVDFSGGYTHERHKRNFFIAEKAGALFQILGDEKYAAYLRDMLFEYAEMYPKLPLHPKERSYARGKLFWQCLNDANWLLYMSLAYDAIYDWLSEEDREFLDTQLFRPFADFLSSGNPQFFNRVHNHSTWGTAAVGMLGLVLDDSELIERALYGLKDDGLELGALDDDGGFIKVADQRVGFLANLEEPFSPDGYYTEGPYYQRYAMYPFLAFAIAMENAKPEYKVLQHKNNVLIKAVNALVQLSDANGDFFAINDAQKGMSIFTPSMALAVSAAYVYGGKNPELLSVAEGQGRVRLDQAGLALAVGLADGRGEPRQQRSVLLRDGPEGEQGGIGVLRRGDLSAVFKFTAQGLSHGHYDKLSYSFHDNGDEIIQDYGLVRFVNIGQKGGGNYLPENTTWAKQSIAHNTMVIDQKSHFDGEYATGSQHHSTLAYASLDDESLLTIYAEEDNAYPGTNLRRSLSLVSLPELDRPLLVDLFKVSGRAKTIDIPTHYLGQFIEISEPLIAPTTLVPLGTDSGYQHILEEARTDLSSGTALKFTWLNANRFYTMFRSVKPGDTFIHGRLGVNDPDFNLRRDPVLIHRRSPLENRNSFVSVIESHGSYSPVTELSTGQQSAISGLDVVLDSREYTVATIALRSGDSFVLAWAHENLSAVEVHEIRLPSGTLRWIGPQLLEKRVGETNE